MANIQELVKVHAAMRNMKRAEMEETTTDGAELGKQVLAELVPVAQEVMKVIADASLPMGDIIQNQNERPEEYVRISRAVQEILLRHNIRWVDRHFVFQLVLQPFDLIKTIVLTDLERTFERKMSSIFGVGSFSEVDLQQLDSVFKEADEANKKS